MQRELRQLAHSLRGDRERQGDPPGGGVDARSSEVSFELRLSLSGAKSERNI